jgi:hypothetical protein
MAFWEDSLPGLLLRNNSNDIDLVYSTILLKELAEMIIRCTKRKVAYKDIHVQSSSS